MNRKIEWWTPEVGNAEYDLVRQVLVSGYLNDGEVTADFECRVGELLNVKHVLAVTSGTTAISLALMAAEVGPGDEVIVPDITFIATANAVRLAGARPVLADVDPRTLNLDPSHAESLITERTKAIVPVHVSGRPANLGAIQALAKRFHLAVIEDAAEAFMSKGPGGAFLGTLGDAGCLSFSPNKTITTGQGGAVLTNDEGLFRRLKELKDQGRPIKGTGGDDVHHSVGFNFKFTNLQAAVGIGQLGYLAQRVARLKRTYQIYREQLEGVRGITLPGFDLESGASPQWVDALVDRRDELDRHLSELGIFCRRFWFPLHTQKPYRQPDDKFPNATMLSTQALWLPSAFTLTDQDVSWVCENIRKFLR